MTLCLHRLASRRQESTAAPIHMGVARRLWNDASPGGKKVATTNTAWVQPNEYCFRKSVRLLIEHQLPSGELPLFVTEESGQYPTRYMKTVFLTAFQAALHADIPDPDVQFVTQRSLRFLQQERSADGLWRFFGRGSRIDADIDDTFAALAAFRNDTVVRSSVLDVMRRLRSMREPSGLFRTWFTRPDIRCDLTVNANLLMYLSLLGVDNQLCEALLLSVMSALRLGELPVSRYYLSSATMRFALSNCALLPCRRFVGHGFPYCLDSEKAWFIQNSASLFYNSPVLPAILAITQYSNKSTHQYLGGTQTCPTNSLVV